MWSEKGWGWRGAWMWMWGSPVSTAAVVYPEVIAGLTHKPLPRQRRAVNNRRAATAGTQTQISLKVKDGRALEQELRFDTSLIHEEGSPQPRRRKHRERPSWRGPYALTTPSLPHVTHAHIHMSCCDSSCEDRVLKSSLTEASVVLFPFVHSCPPIADKIGQ